jgi:hypothetical protein
MRSRFARGRPSSRNGVGNVSGVADLAFVGTQVYAVTADGGCSHGHLNFPNSILLINADGSWSKLANLSAFQMAHPVANPNPPDFEPDGVWYSLISVDSNLFAVEPNPGEVDEITPEGIVSRYIDVFPNPGPRRSDGHRAYQERILRCEPWPIFLVMISPACSTNMTGRRNGRSR